MCDVETERCDTIGMNDELKPAARIALIMVRRRPSLGELVGRRSWTRTEISRRSNLRTVWGLWGNHLDDFIFFHPSSSIHHLSLVGLR